MTTAVAEARAKHQYRGLEDAFTVLHPKLKAYAAEHGTELSDSDAVSH